jgi:hypothetical protein
MDVLILDELKNGLPTLSKGTGTFLTEAAQYCLESHSHESGVIASTIGNNPNKYELIWESIIDDATNLSRRDPDEMVEFGSTCIAILLCIKKTKFTGIERAMKKTGIDWWIGDLHRNQKNEPYIQHKIRLEISGIYNGCESKLKQRVREKLEQTKQSDDSRRVPVIVVVVEFSKPMIGLKER